MKCAYCGLDFDLEASRRSCQGCLLRGGCQSVRCPRCGYETPEVPALVEKLIRWPAAAWERWRESSPAPEGEAPVLCLADMHPRQRGVIVSLNGENPKTMRKLMALGLLPGTAVHLRRRFPSFVFWVGFSQFAVDREISGAIHVRLNETVTA